MSGWGGLVDGVGGVMLKLTLASSGVGVKCRAKYYLLGLVVGCCGWVDKLMLKLT